MTVGEVVQRVSRAVVTMSSFYVTLPSNASLDMFDDTLTHYRVQMGAPLTFDEGEWLVGMTDIQYPNTWQNVHEAALFIRKKGLELYNEKEPDLVVVDLNIPEIRGLDLLSQMKKMKMKIS